LSRNYDVIDGGVTQLVEAPG